MLLYFLFYRLTSPASALPGNGYVPLTQNPVAGRSTSSCRGSRSRSSPQPTYARLTRGSMLDVLGEDYIRTARAKGMRERRVIYRHALRSALTPVVTQLGIDFGTLLGGVIIVENIFGLPGLGQMAVQSVLQQDLPVVIGTIIVAATFIVVANILVDIMYGWLDPRVRVH